MSAKRNPAQEEQTASKSRAKHQRKGPTAYTPEAAAQTPNQGLRTKKLRGADMPPQAGHAATAPRKASKQQLVLGLLSAVNGVSISEIMAATNWRPHSTRAVLSRLRKKGYILDRQKAEGRARYKVLGTPPTQNRA
jgi:hypothetical protein